MGLLSGALDSVVGGVVGAATGSPGTAKPTWEQIISNAMQQGSSQTTTDQTMSELLNAIQQAQSSQSTTGESTSQNLTGEQEQVINNLLGSLQQEFLTDSPYSQEKAMEAGQGAMNAAIDRTLQSGIGDVAASGSNAGAYNSTVTGRLATQLGTEAVNQGQKSLLDTQLAFGNLDQQRTSNLGSVINQLLGSAINAGGTTTTGQNVTGSQSSTTQQGSTQQGSSNVSEETQASTDTSQTTDTEYDIFGKKKSLFR